MGLELPALRARSFGASLDPSYPHYYRDLSSVVRGLERYVRTLRTSAGPLELVYFDNLAWDAMALSREPKPRTLRDFSSFAKYRAFLAGSLDGLAENLAAESRARRYRMLGTLSTGYDSSTVATLAREAGCEEVLCFDRAWPERDRERALRERCGEIDSGAENARVLGLRPVVVPLDGWRALEMPEVPFLAVNGMGEEVRFKTAEQHLADRVLLTGYHGDKMWAKQAYDLSPDIVRGDPSGSALGEYRLWTGFLHCPVAFWGCVRSRMCTRSPTRPRWRPGTCRGTTVVRSAVASSRAPAYRVSASARASSPHPSCCMTTRLSSPRRRWRTTFVGLPRTEAPGCAGARSRRCATSSSIGS